MSQRLGGTAHLVDEGFDPDHQPERLRDRDAFLAGLAELGELDGPGEASHVASCATRLLSR